MNVLEGIISEERRYGSMPYIETGTNHQIFSDIVDAYGLSGFQNGAWCATYQFAMELIMCGKETALSHWCMESDYVGYNVFATRNAFKAKGRTGSSPRLGSLVIFKRSHMGRVLSINGDTFQCGEGNTSNSEFDRDGDSCAVKSYSVTDPGIDCFCYIDYGDNRMTPTKLIKATAAVYQMAHNEKFRYGDSKTLPPCEDHLISCDRLIARALWNLGYQDQPKGGITVLNMEQYLPKYGTTKIMREEDIKAGDIVVMKENGTTMPTADWHTYLATAVTKSGSVIRINKYDCGSQQRIAAIQPFVNVPINQWPGQKSFYCAFRFDDTPEPDDFYSFDADYYRTAYADVVKAVGSSAEALKKHYNDFGKREGRAADCILTPSYYKLKYKDLRAAFGSNWASYIDHFTSYGVREGRRGSVVFDYSYYRGKYKDLQSAFKNDKKAYYRHFLTYGMREGRQGSKDFNPQAYRKRYKDLNKAFGDNWRLYYMHYLIYGTKEKRNGK